MEFALVQADLICSLTELVETVQSTVQLATLTENAQAAELNHL